MIFNSPGGNLVGGMALGTVIEEFKLNTGVAAGGRCGSACIFAWGAGKAKSAAPDSEIAVHAPHNPNAPDTPATREIARNVNVNSAQWLIKHGAPYNVVIAFQTTPPESAYWLTPQDLAGWHVHVTY
jgi:hypothetical protein